MKTKKTMKTKKMSKKKFQDFVKTNCPTVKFKTNMFGTLPKGTIIDLYKISECDNRALLFAPYDKTGCGCFTIATIDEDDGYYVDVNKDSYVNFDT